MIAHVKGTLTEKDGNTLIVDVNGIGYEIQVSLSDYENTLLNNEVIFYTHHHIREQSQDLFGFSSLAAKKLFELLINVQGVGPKAALAIISLGNSESIRNAIFSSDIKFISRANGVGKKTAERICLELKDKVGGYKVSIDNSFQDDDNLKLNDEAMEALIALGYNLSDASKLLEGIPNELTTSEKVMLALKNLNK